MPAGSQHQDPSLLSNAQSRAQLPNELWLGPGFPQSQRGSVGEGPGGREPGLVPWRKPLARRVQAQVGASSARSHLGPRLVPVTCSGANGKHERRLDRRAIWVKQHQECQSTFVSNMENTSTGSMRDT